MFMEYAKPNFNNNIINVSATLAEYLGVETDKPKLAVLQDALNEHCYKNVVFICFDGMGIYPLSTNLSSTGILRKSIVQTLTSTFPSTTTNATTTLSTCTYPLEHGWFGWSLHIDDIDKNVDVYWGTDSQSGKTVTCKYPMNPNDDYYFDAALFDGTISLVAPQYVAQAKNAQNYVATTLVELQATLLGICQNQGRQFVYAYCPQPDSTMHEYGVINNTVVKSLFAQIEGVVNALISQTEDTLFVITADHGQIDVAGEVEFWRDKELCAMLECPPYLDARTPCFRVKPQHKEDFERIFKAKYSDDFLLYKTSELVSDGYFGPYGDKAFMLGDYIAIGTFTHKLFVGSKPRDNFHFKGHHTSTTEEMLVPLIIIKNR